jgi:hypothetical protein
MNIERAIARKAIRDEANGMQGMVGSWAHHTLHRRHKGIVMAMIKNLDN